MKQCALILLVILSSFTLKAQSNLTAKHITERFIQVSGDFTTIANARIVISSEPFTGMVVDMEIIKDSSHKLHQTIRFYDSTRKRKITEVTTIYNKGKAVKIDNGKKEAITDKLMLDDMHLNSFIFSEYAYRTDAYKLELEGIESIDNREYYRINITTPNGLVISNYYDKDNGFLVYMNTPSMKSHFTDYQQRDGKFYPMTIYGEAVDGVLFTFKIKAIYFNEKLKPTLFNL